MRTHFACRNDQVSGPYLPYNGLLSFSDVNETTTQEPSIIDVKSHQVQDIRTVEKRLPTFETAVDANTAQTGLSSKLLARMRTSLSPTGHDTNNINLSQRGVPLEHGSPLQKKEKLPSVSHQ